MGFNSAFKGLRRLFIMTDSSLLKLQAEPINILMIQVYMPTSEHEDDEVEEGRKNYRRLRNELKRDTDNAKKEYLENIRKEIMEFQRTGRYDLMYMKTKD
jgi:hypothetical protein